jgi:hypothetical protein
VTLRDQIREIARRVVDEHFAADGQFPMIVTALAAKAFIEEWPDATDTRAVRRAARLLSNPGWVTIDEEAVS